MYAMSTTIRGVFLYLTREGIMKKSFLIFFISAVICNSLALFSLHANLNSKIKNIWGLSDIDEVVEGVADEEVADNRPERDFGHNNSQNENTNDNRDDNTDTAQEVVNEDVADNTTDEEATQTEIVETQIAEADCINGIAVKLYAGNNVAISWDIVAGIDVEYSVYRSYSPISNSASLADAIKVANTKYSFVNDRLDKEAKTYYYVTANKFDSNVFVAGENYTVAAIEPIIDRGQKARESNVDGSRFVYYRVNSLTANIEDEQAVLEWKESSALSSEEYHYLLFSSTNNFHMGQNILTSGFLSEAKKITPDNVYKTSSGVVRYIEEEPSEIMNTPIYYSLIVVVNDYMPSVVLAAGMYTEKPIEWKEEVKEEVINIGDAAEVVEIEEEPDSSEVIESIEVEEKPVEVSEASKTTEEKPAETSKVVEQKPAQSTKPTENKTAATNDKAASRTTLAETRVLYTRASTEFNKKNYTTVKNILEGKTISEENRKLYYDTNLILAISYYRLGESSKAFETLKKIRHISPAEVDFWAGQILGDL